ncbi:PaaX family transcriptional regulator C-terminal domain-containing protein [Actinophytocola gossypii]|uniref:PaaX domain-containing protein, C- domain protein n=1 Tax=Actinophytocola gossypii TaxID=2812003 RepID=A0ABT2JBZ3_9PSEU|nr:PaaX family transcriptional regulator C-terminal domain-containing protein [Actinophytocola gossypii]MCT2585381.1 PaaX domain-containing protein, C- domain protein [Actinophytocola gossypii]
MGVPDIPGLRPLTARSVVLSTLLGTHPPRLPARSLVQVGGLFGITEGTIRVALSRMVAAGDLRQVDGDYELTDRLAGRQARQDQSRSPATRPWSGDWEIVVVTADRRSPASRTAFRQTMAGLRLAEVREGTWLRPANLDRPLDLPCLVLLGRPAIDPVALAASLWDLPAWADRARLLHDGLDETARSGDLAAGFIVSAAVLRHLVADPLLPGPLLPSDWPGAELRARYDRFEETFQSVLRDRLGVG